MKGKDLSPSKETNKQKEKITMTNKHYELIQQYYNEVSQETKDKYQGKTGIYAIYCDEALVYIGKSTDLLNRFIAHKANTFCDESPEYNSKKYQ